MLKVHPDKNPDDPNAAKVFNEVQQAYDIALDPKAREAWMQLKQCAPYARSGVISATAAHACLLALRCWQCYNLFICMFLFPASLE